MENLHKLVTKEDPIYVHKMLGIICLVNYIYRFWSLLCYNTMLLNTDFDMLLVAVHGGLSISSFIFHIPKKRHVKLPMIYPEFRLHSIAFALRSVACCFLCYYGSKYQLYYKICACYITMMTADTITKYHTIEGDTTMRSMPYSDTICEYDKRNITKFHSNQQVTATLFMLLNIDSAFAPMFPIQIAALFMSLVRKNIITPNTWHLLYSLSLMTCVFVFNNYTLSQVLVVVITTNIFRILRMKLRMNKYLSWSIVFSMILVTDLTSLDTFAYTRYITNGILIVYLTKNTYTIRTLLSGFIFTRPT
jgi:hypothetical protein